MGSHRIFWTIILSLGLLVLSACGDDVGEIEDGTLVISSSNPDIVPCEPDNEDNNEECIRIPLPCTDETLYNNAGWYGKSCMDAEILIPDGRPIYAFLVSGFQQNRDLDMFHFYNFAKCIFESTKEHEKMAYVHYAWWNNLLAPYMEEPLHNYDSVPSIGGLLDTLPDYFGFDYDPDEETSWKVPTKAIPAEDYQFQKDAKTVLTAIRSRNPDAAIILVGHSMGGDAVVRLADSMGDNFEIAMLAPIDPVGNRTCLPDAPLEPGQMTGPSNTSCIGSHNFTRFQATHTDWFLEPYRVSYQTNIKYLYYRWQDEFLPPFDWGCPYYFLECPLYFYMFDWWDVWFRGVAADEVQLPDRYRFRHPVALREGINQGSTNVQARVPTSILSGTAVSHPLLIDYNSGGGIDGHGEIVGFRGVDPDDPAESYPLALAARGEWPSRSIENCDGDDVKPSDCRRVQLLKEWENDPYYLDVYHGLPGGEPEPHAPVNPEYCMVSGDLCTILKTEVDIPDIHVNVAPAADAGPDQIVECSSPNGTEVRLDGSGSRDPDDDSLTYTWNWQDGTTTTTENTVFTSFPLGTHLVTLIVDDGDLTNTDTVDITVQDTAAPTLSLSLSPNSLWAPNHKLVKVTADIEMGDSCDDSPTVKLVSITSNEADDGKGDGHTNGDIQEAEFGTDDREFWLRTERAGHGLGRVYTVTYEATDASGNVTEATAEVTVSHDQGGM